MLSLINAPVACDVIVGAVGAVASKVNVKAVALDALVAVSVRRTLTSYELSDNVGAVCDHHVVVTFPV